MSQDLDRTISPGSITIGAPAHRPRYGMGHAFDDDDMTVSSRNRIPLLFVRPRTR